MKLISILLATLILSFSAIPCCEAEDNCQEEILSNSSESTHHSGSEESNLPCSPFYSCGTCTGFSLISLHFDSTWQITESSFLSSAYQSSISKAYKIALLRPPKGI
jgi:hypothetical protein